MNIYAISDLHLSFFNQSTPMHKYGEMWKNHTQKVKDNWEEKITNDDLVLIGGDISLSVRLNDAKTDLNWIKDLPGKKVFVKGNHDFWWNSIKKIRENFNKDLFFIQNDSVLINDVAIGGSRLWSFPFVFWDIPSKVKSKAGQYPKDNKKIRAREIDRLRSSLKSIPKDAGFKIALLHFPPIGQNPNHNVLTEMMSEYSIDLCVFGHLHNLKVQKKATDCVIDKTRYVLASCDWLNFNPLKVK